MTQKPSPIRQAILKFIIKYMEEKAGRSPTNREIGDSMRSKVTGKSKSTGYIAYHLEVLEKEGYIERDAHTSRSIRVLKDWFGSPLSAIAAGPQRTVATIIRQSPELLAKKSFLLRVEGQSMFQDNIFDGDYIIVDPEQQIKNGDIVVATHLNAVGSTLGAATVKRFYKENGRVRLQPANSAMEPIYVEAEEWDNEWEVQGRATAVLHLLSK